MAERSGARRRWGVVAVVVAVLVALPLVTRAWPAPDDSRSAARLRTAALASADVAFSGYAESSGGLALPASDQLTTVADLLSSRTKMRVWWAGPADNRVDVVTGAGETDVHTDAAGTWTWNYEDNRASRTETVAPLTLPAPPDLLPTTLGRRLLSEAEPGELSRLGAARVAGRQALGLRLVPAAVASSIARVDLWIDGDSGLPLQVRVFGKGAANPAMDTRFLDLDLGAPPASVTSFSPPPDTTVEEGDDSAVLQAAENALSPLPLPTTLAGLPRRTLAGAPAAVGLYGRGVTLLAVVPLSYGIAASLRRAAEQDPSAVTDKLGTRLTAGPLGILLTRTAGGDLYVLTGTVTLDALQQAARQLPDLAGAP